MKNYLERLYSSLIEGFSQGIVIMLVVLALRAIGVTIEIIIKSN